MALICKVCIKAPEDLDDTHVACESGLRNIAARRGNGTDNGKRTLTAVTAERNDAAGTLVELCQTAPRYAG